MTSTRRQQSTFDRSCTQRVIAKHNLGMGSDIGDPQVASLILPRLLSKVAIELRFAAGEGTSIMVGLEDLDVQGCATAHDAPSWREMRA